MEEASLVDHLTELRVRLVKSIVAIASCFILHLLSGPMIQPSFLQTQATKVGYDVGFCDEETQAALLRKSNLSV